VVGILRISARNTGRGRCEQDVFGSFQLALYKRLVDDDLGCYIRQFASLPEFDLLSHRLEVPLHTVDTDGNAVNERERLRVFGEHRGKRAWDNAPNQALFFDVMTEKADQRCSTSLLPQSGQRTSP
jgi:hypothetical protein